MMGESATIGDGTIAGVAQLVERKPSKLDVAGSSPVSRSRAGMVDVFGSARS